MKIRITDKSSKFYEEELEENRIYYENQRLEKFLKELGANVGDTVEIVETGSGSYSPDFKKSGQHEITKITSSGYVQFDNGKAEIFKPKVKVISKMPKVESFSIGVGR